MRLQASASLRSDGVRDHLGMPFGFIPDSGFGFAGILNASLSDSDRMKIARANAQQSFHLYAEPPAFGLRGGTVNAVFGRQTGPICRLAINRRSTHSPTVRVSPDGSSANRKLSRDHAVKSW